MIRLMEPRFGIGSAGGPSINHSPSACCNPLAGEKNPPSPMYNMKRCCRAKPSVFVSIFPLLGVSSPSTCTHTRERGSSLVINCQPQDQNHQQKKRRRGRRTTTTTTTINQDKFSWTSGSLLWNVMACTTSAKDNENRIESSRTVVCSDATPGPQR